MEIWKFELEVTDEQTIEMPLDAEILTVQVQHGVPCIWVAVVPTNLKVKRGIRIAGTGHTLLTTNGYIGTFQMMGGNLMFHVIDQGVKD